VELTFETWPIDRCIDYARNPRKNDHAVDKVAAAIREFGFRVPIVAKSDGLVVDGHLRLKAAKKLGLTEVPVILADDMSEAQIKAFRLSVNKVAELAEWDTDLLGLEIADLKEMGFDLELTGFDAAEIDALFPDEPSAGLTDEDAVPEAPEQPVTVEGDVWVLGRHRLMCGDSTSIDAVDRMMPEAVANMIFTDPPYLMNFTGGIHADGSKSFNAKHGSIKNDKMTEREGDDFLDAINAVIRSKVDGAFYISFYRLGIAKYLSSMERTGLKNRALVIWDKGNHTLSNSDYMSMYEPIFYGWVNSHKFYGGKNGMDIWRIKRTAKNDLHPTMKPVELVCKAIEDGSQVNGVVLDLFGGSGTTLIAAEKLNRQARLMELDPRYCDVIIKRWQDFTGQQATFEATGQTYEELKAERQAA